MQKLVCGIITYGLELMEPMANLWPSTVNPLNPNSTCNINDSDAPWQTVGPRRERPLPLFFMEFVRI